MWVSEARNIVLIPYPVIFCDQHNAFFLSISLSVFAFHNNSYDFMVLYVHFSLFLSILSGTK